MITAKKTLAAVMAVSLLFSTLIFTGCNKKGNEEKIPEDEAWYSVKQTSIGEQFQLDKDVEYSFIRFLGATDECVVFSAEIHRTAVDDRYLKSGDPDDQDQLYFEVYGNDGNLKKTIDVKQKIKDSGMFKLDPDDYPHIVKRLRKDEEEKDGSVSDKTDLELFKENGIKVSWNLMENYSIAGNYISVELQAFYPMTDKGNIDLRNVEVVFDADTGDITRYKFNDQAAELEALGNYTVGDYEVKLIKRKDGDSVLTYLEIKGPGGSAHSSRSHAENGLGFGDKDKEALDSMIYLGGDKALIIMENNEDFSVRCYELNLKNGEITDSAMDLTWIRSELYNATFVKDVGYVIVDPEGLKKIDFAKKEKVSIFSFDTCNLNRALTINMKLLGIVGDTIYMSGLTDVAGKSFDPNDSGESLFVLTKEKVNPNAGKTVIHASFNAFYDYTECEAVTIFNENSEEYFIKLDNKYSAMQKVYSGELSFFDDDYEEKYNKLIAELSYQLGIDLVNSEGPDIVLDYAGVTFLNDDRYFLDLKKEIKTDGLFENIIKASEHNGKVYQLPLGVTLGGIVVMNKYAGEDQYGFTFDQYKDLVKGTCNGTDPLNVFAEQDDYFLRCLMTMPDSYMEKDQVNFDTPAFRTFAEYTKENVSAKKVLTEDYSFYEPVEKGKRSVRYDVGLTIPTLLKDYADCISDIRVMGLPSYDGRGPAMNAATSVAISATTKEKKACLEFVEVLLSDEIQESIQVNENLTPIRKSAYEAASAKAIDEYNNVFKKYKNVFFGDSLRESGYPWCNVDKKAIKDYEAILEKSTVILEDDPAISIIVREEMPAYFTGQKSLDDVIKIINDRSQTYMNERRK